jgi:hypothetical protein
VIIIRNYLHVLILPLSAAGTTASAAEYLAQRAWWHLCIGAFDNSPWMNHVPNHNCKPHGNSIEYVHVPFMLRDGIRRVIPRGELHQTEDDAHRDEQQTRVQGI